MGTNQHWKGTPCAFSCKRHMRVFVCARVCLESNCLALVLPRQIAMCACMWEREDVSV